MPSRRASIALMEPMLVPTAAGKLGDLLPECIAKAHSLASLIPEEVRIAVGDLVRSMNCYYSNLIEGHNTHPRDIDRALKKNFANEPHKRDLQREAVAHIAVQQAIDNGESPQAHPASREYILWLHRAFCERLPEDLLWVANPDNGERLRVLPGILRERDVIVGRHVPPCAADLDAFMTRFAAVYTDPSASQIHQILAIAAAHHRLVWIHPFLDGNGRVSRLHSYAMLKRLNLGTPLWSIARGLARSASRYKDLLQAADGLRRTGYDGRGNLSEAALVAFTEYFLESCIDQIDFMSELLNLQTLQLRMRLYVEEEVAAKRLHKASFAILREALLCGSVPRGKAAEITGYGERMAREITTQLLHKELLRSDGPRAELRLNFPIDIVERWFPGMYSGRI